MSTSTSNTCLRVGRAIACFFHSSDATASNSATSSSDRPLESGERQTLASGPKAALGAGAAAPRRREPHGAGYLEPASRERAALWCKLGLADKVIALLHDMPDDCPELHPLIAFKLHLDLADAHYQLGHYDKSAHHARKATARVLSIAEWSDASLVAQSADRLVRALACSGMDIAGVREQLQGLGADVIPRASLSARAMLLFALQKPGGDDPLALLGLPPGTTAASLLDEAQTIAAKTGAGAANLVEALGFCGSTDSMRIVNLLNRHMAYCMQLDAEPDAAVQSPVVREIVRGNRWFDEQFLVSLNLAPRQVAERSACLESVLGSSVAETRKPTEMLTEAEAAVLQALARRALPAPTVPSSHGKLRNGYALAA